MARVYRDDAGACTVEGAPADTIEVLTMRDDRLCGVALEIGERYVLFTDAAVGKAIVQACSRTELAGRAARTLRALGRPSDAR